MAFEPVFEELTVDSRRKLAVTQAVVEARILPPPGTAIARVLAISAEASVAPTEVFAGEARLGGKVNFKVLFVDVDGKNHCAEHVADFSDKAECAAVTAATLPAFTASVLDTDVVSVSQGELRLASVVEITLFADVSEKVMCLRSGGEGVYTRGEDIVYSRLVSRGSGAAKAAAEADAAGISCVLFSEHVAAIKKREAGAGHIVLSGTVYGKIVGETADGLITQILTETDFSEEIGAAGATPGCSVLASVTAGATVELEEGEERRAITVNYDLGFDFCVYSVGGTTVITDAFGATNELLVTESSLTAAEIKPALTVLDRVEGNVTLEASMPIVDSVLGSAAFRMTVTKAAAGEGEANVEGLIEGNVVYYGAEAGTENSVAVELPFSLRLPAEGVRPGDELTVRGDVTGVTAKIRRGNEISVSADAAFTVEPVAVAAVAVISGLEEGEPRILPTAAFSVHVARAGESLWDIARLMGSTPDEIEACNPGLNLPLAGGERVTLYRHLTRRA